MENSYCICILTALVFINTMRTEQRCGKGAKKFFYINLIDYSNLTVNENAILTRFIFGLEDQQKLSSWQILFEKVTNRLMIFNRKNLSARNSKLFDFMTSKACYFTEFSHLSLFNEEDRHDTNSELLVVVFNKVVENWRSYGDNDYG